MEYINIPILDQVVNKFYSFTEEMKKRKFTGKVVNFAEKEDDIYGIIVRRHKFMKLKELNMQMKNL